MSSARSKATKSCCARHSATCCEMRSKPAPAQSVAPVVVIRSELDPAQPVMQNRRRGQRSGHRAGGARAGLPAVLHLEAQRHRPRPRPRPEDHRVSQRPDHRRLLAARRREPSGLAAPRLVADSSYEPPIDIGSFFMVNLRLTTPLSDSFEQRSIDDSFRGWCRPCTVRPRDLSWPLSRGRLHSHRSARRHNHPDHRRRGGRTPHADVAEQRAFRLADYHRGGACTGRDGAAAYLGLARGGIGAVLRVLRRRRSMAGWRRQSTARYQRTSGVGPSTRCRRIPATHVSCRSGSLRCAPPESRIWSA